MLELLTILYRWKWHIALFCSLALLASIIFSGPKFMPPYFESYSVFYPSNPAATDRTTLFGGDAGDRQVSYFGTKSDLNRMLTIANSGGLMNHLIDRFDLVNHYKADTTNPKYPFYVAREFKGNYEAIKTDKDAIRIGVFDRDAETAARMANEAVAYINEVNNSIIRDNKMRTLDILSREIKAKQAGLDAIEESRQRNSQEMEFLVEELARLKQLHDQYKVSANEGFASIYVIEAATPALVKAKPVRWMIVVMTGLGAFSFAALMAILLEKFKTVKAIA